MEEIKKDFNPLVSIVIPVYNGSNYMREAIDSALAQTYKNIEIIVVNDGSIDNTEEIAKSYGNKIKYFSKENGGVSTALNLGLEKMKGDYFSWLSHDDAYYPEKIERQIKKLSELEEKEKFNTILMSNYSVINEKSEITSTVEFHTLYGIDNLNYPFSALLKGCAYGCTLLIPKHCFENVGYFEIKLRATQDYDLWFKMFLKYKTIFMPDLLVKVRVHPKQQGKKIIKIVNQEGDELWIKMVKGLTNEQKRVISGSLLSFYKETYDILKDTGYSGAKKYLADCIDKFKKRDILKIKVSVIIPFYNRIEWTLEAIKSVLSQTHNNLEIILINDSSTDNIDPIINIAKSDNRIILIDNKRRKGVSGARNSGIDMAAGEYVAFLDSDDLYLPEKIEKHLEFMVKNGYQLSHTSYSLFSESNERGVVINSGSDDGYYPNIISCCKIAPSMVIMDTDLLKDGSRRFPEEYALAEDICFWIMLTKILPCKGIDKVLTKKRNHKENAAEDPLKQVIGINNIISYTIANFLNEKTSDSIKKLQQTIENELDNCFKNKNGVTEQNSESTKRPKLSSLIYIYSKQAITHPLKFTKKCILKLQKYNLSSKKYLILFFLKYKNISLTIIRSILRVESKEMLRWLIFKMSPTYRMLVGNRYRMNYLLEQVKNLEKFNKRYEKIILSEIKTKKILVVAMLNSIHTARWLSQFADDENYEMHLFPVNSWKVHDLILNQSKFIIYNYDFSPESGESFNASCAIENIINTVRPDIVHTLEMQHSAYLVLPIKQKMGKDFPIWFYSCWGSDIKWFERYTEHKEKISKVLNNCDALFSGDRDSIKKAINEYGFNKPVLNVPSPGGYKVDYYINKIKFIPPSKRKIILVKGYSGWVYRPDVVFAALKKCKDQLIENKMKVVVFLGGEVKSYVDEIKKLGISIEMFAYTNNYDDVIELYSRSKISLASSLSDGVPNSMLESMLMGCFPILSNSGSASEYITNEENGFLLNPEDVDGYVSALKKSLADNNLLNSAAEVNRNIIKNRLDYDVIKNKVLNFYERFI